MAGENTVNYTEQGGARSVIGGSLDVVSGGEIDIENGGALKIAGTAVTASAEELNILKGVTKTSEQINALPIVEQEAIADIATADADAAAGETPTKAEFDKVVALANANKAKINSILAALRAASIISE